MNEKRIGIVLLNWNGHRDTLECVESLRASRRAFHELVVVDNGSRDGSPEILKKHFAERKDPFHVELILLDRNTGFTGGVNTGLNYLKERCDAYWLLNNDTYVDPGALDALARAIFEEGHPVATSKILVRDSDPPVIWFAGGDDTLPRMHIHSPLRGVGEVDRGQFDAARSVDFASGCSLFISRLALDQIGLLDDIFFAYGEDADWAFRAREKGISIRYVPASVVWHGVSRSTGDNNRFGGRSHPIQYYLNVRSRLILLRRHLDGLRRLYALAYFLAPYPAIMLYNLLRGRRVKARAIWLGILDGARSDLRPRRGTNEEVLRRIEAFR